jgi:hypothetical protein
VLEREGEKEKKKKIPHSSPKRNAEFGITSREKIK